MAAKLPTPQQLWNAGHNSSTLELLGVSPKTNNLIGGLAGAAEGGAAVVGAAGAAGAASGDAAAAESAGGSAAGGTAASGAASGLSTLAKGAALGGITAFLTSGQNWLRLGEVLAGALLLLFGLLTLSGGGASGAAKSAAKAARL